MRIKQVSEKVGLSHQAIYKRLRARGIKAEDITQKNTGELTAEGWALMLELFPILQGEEERSEQPQAEAPAAAEPSEIERLQGEVARLRGEVAQAEGKVATMEAQLQALTEERDYLRGALERSQQLQALTAQKIPNPPPALPAGGDQQRRGLFGWLRRKDQRTGE